MFELDVTDRRIIRVLQRDGRTPNVDIARQVGVTEGTVRKRLERLLEHRVLRIGVFPDPCKIGYSTHTFIGLQVDLGELDHVIEQLLRKPEVCSLYHVTGEFDLIIEALFPNTDGLLHFLTEEVGKMKGVHMSSTSHVLRVVKSACDWGIPCEEEHEVLVVDDDPDFVEFCRTVLEKEGFQVTSAATGAEALAHVQTSRPAVVLLDIMMRDILDGLHAAHAMRADKELAQIPIVIVSSIADSDYAGMFPTDEYVPVNGFLSKPVAPQKLISEVQRLVSKAQEG